MKIALYGQIDNDTKFDFTYPDVFVPTRVTEKDAWLRAISDPRDARFFTTERVYAMWRNELGNYYALIEPNKNDARNGYLILTLFTGHSRPQSGAFVLSVLTHLEQMIIGQGIRDHQYLDEYLSTLSNSFVADRAPFTNTKKSSAKAFRTYSSQSQLEQLIMKASQEENSRYDRVLLVPKEAVPDQLTSAYVEVKDPVVVPRQERPAPMLREQKGKPAEQKVWQQRLTWFGLGVITGIVLMLLFRSCGNDDESEITTVTSTVQTTDSVSQNKEVTDSQPASQDLEKQIKSYMKRIDVWEQDSMRIIQAYDDLFRYIQNGDIDGILNSSYSNLPENDPYLNGLWKKAVRQLREINDKDKAVIDRAKLKLKTMTKDKKCDLAKLLTELTKTNNGEY